MTHGIGASILRTRQKTSRSVLAAWCVVAACGLSTADTIAEPVADKPLFVDPVYDGAADPAVVWNHATDRWFMFYTNRRANLADPGPGVSWVHGTRIGIAESIDAGASWTYVGEADIDVADGAPQTHWAPAIVEHEGVYHMYLTHVPGVFASWDHPREIVHLTSRDLRTWTTVGPLKLHSDRVIDAAILRLPDGRWRMFYNDEPDAKAVRYADSDDLFAWEDRGKAFEGPPGEGPVAFRWRELYWLILDEWRGLGVYHSDDATHWTRQEGDRLLSTGGEHPSDAVRGSHPDVVVSGERAYLFYFTHPGRKPGTGFEAPESRRSVLQVAELRIREDRLMCDRDALTHIKLRPSPSATRPYTR